MLLLQIHKRELVKSILKSIEIQKIIQHDKNVIDKSNILFLIGCLFLIKVVTALKHGLMIKLRNILAIDGFLMLFI